MPEGTPPDSSQDLEQQRPPQKPKAKPTGRRPLPQALPRVEIEIIPPEVQHKGLDAFERLPGEVCETLERRRASLVVVRAIGPTFLPIDRERNSETQLLIADPPELPIERGLAGPALLAETLVQRWQDHLPLHRLEQIYRSFTAITRSEERMWS